MISKSIDANENYLCKLVNITDFKPHPNADRLKIATIDFMDVITAIDNPEGSYIYFPVESRISHEILTTLNCYRNRSSEPSLNADPEQSGFFEKNRRCRAVKLRGTKSFGIILPTSEVMSVFGVDGGKVDALIKNNQNEYFDSINGEIIVDKYEKPVKNSNSASRQMRRASRMIDGQVNLHVDTSNLRKYIQYINPSDNITISYKLHGTSGHAHNVLVKRKLNIFERILRKIGVSIQETEYDLVYGSRKVIKNRTFNKAVTDGYYGYDLWGEVVKQNDIAGKLPNGYSIYYEIVGFTNEGGYIQKDFDYGCATNESKLFVYRVTFTNSIGQVYNLNTIEAKAFTERIGLNFVPVIYNGTLENLFADKGWDGNFDDRDGKENIITTLEKEYNNKNCYICKNKVPEEGIVLRVERNNGFEVYKLKSTDFLLKETADMDEGE